MSPKVKNLENLSTLAVKRHVSSTPSGSTVISYAKDLGEGPVLWLVHGYPQSAYIWRHIVPQLQHKISLFVPELPGYGLSTLPKESGPAAIGLALLQASHELFPNRPIILGGHDRGARICHRLAISNAYPPTTDAPNAHDYKLLGTILLDIVPTLTQWTSFSKPQNSTAYFHWPFLASPIAPKMITSFGGDKWALASLSGMGGGPSPHVKEKMQSDDAWEVYSSLHATPEAIHGSCADYASGSNPEPQLQEQDQTEGKKIKSPVLVMWSEKNLGKMHRDVAAIWKEWLHDPEVLLSTQGLGDDIGHFLPEEASEIVGKAVDEFITKIS